VYPQTGQYVHIRLHGDAAPSVNKAAYSALTGVATGGGFFYSDFLICPPVLPCKRLYFRQCDGIAPSQFATHRAARAADFCVRAFYLLRYGWMVSIS
jgi:hypothetical protein